MNAVETVACLQPQRFTLPAGDGLSAEMRSAYERDGFLLLEDFASSRVCANLQQRMAKLVEDWEPAGIGTVFSSADQAHGSERYFLESGEDIRFFFEPGTVDAAGRLIQDKHLAVNKVGHALHDLDPVFAGFSRSQPLARLARDLGLCNSLLLQSMYIFKQPKIGAEVGWHQDASFLYTQPISVIGFWLALDDATAENGCMLALAGGHCGPLRQRFVRRGDGASMVTEAAAPWPAIVPTLLEAPRGSLIVLHGLLPHASTANHSTLSRHAYALHVIDADTRYPADNWLQRSALPLRGFV